MNTKFAENFSALLKIKGISQTQFAKLYGVKQNTVSQWANGKREPTFHDLSCICTLLNIDFKEILGYNPRTKEAILRDIIAGHDDFQKEQAFLISEMRKAGHSSTEISKACDELYKIRYSNYKKVFNFED